MVRSALQPGPETGHYHLGLGVDTEVPEAEAHVHSGADITSGTVADARVASTIARDSEVTTAVNDAVTALVGAAPAALNTLVEIAAALDDDADLAGTLTTAIGTKLNASAVSAFGLTLLDDADAATARATLGVADSVRGSVNGNGTIARGTGFTVVRNADGDYTVTFTTPFAAAPVVVATVNGAFGGGQAPSIAVTDSLTNQVEIRTGTVGVALTDQAFDFLAVAV